MPDGTFIFADTETPISSTAPQEHNQSVTVPDGTDPGKEQGSDLRAIVSATSTVVGLGLLTVVVVAILLRTDNFISRFCFNALRPHMEKGLRQKGVVGALWKAFGALLYTVAGSRVMHREFSDEAVSRIYGVQTINRLFSRKEDTCSNLYSPNTGPSYSRLAQASVVW